MAQTRHGPHGTGARGRPGRGPLPRALTRRSPVFFFGLVLVSPPLRPFTLRPDDHTWALLSFAPGTPEAAKLWPKEGGEAGVWGTAPQDSEASCSCSWQCRPQVRHVLFGNLLPVFKPGQV